MKAYFKCVMKTDKFKKTYKDSDKGSQNCLQKKKSRKMAIAWVFLHRRKTTWNISAINKMINT